MTTPFSIFIVYSEKFITYYKKFGVILKKILFSFQYKNDQYDKYYEIYDSMCEMSQRGSRPRKSRYRKSP